MKLSSQHASGGLSGHIRSTQTGEVVHFQFPKGIMRLPVEVLLGDKRLEVYLRVELVDTDVGDDVDMELILRAPDVAATASLDYTPRIAPPPAGGKIDQDGAAMAAPSSKDEVEIKEGPPSEVREMVLGEDERDSYTITPTQLALDRAEESEAGLFDGEDQVGSDDPLKDEHPATKIPELPGVGTDRKAKKGKR